MTTLSTFTKRLAVRLSTFTNSTKVRESAKNIEVTIENEIEIITNYNSTNGTSINEFALSFLAYKNGNVPKTKVKQNEWLSATINELQAA